MKKKYKLIEAFILINILIYMLVIFQSSTCFATEKNTFIKRTTIKYVEAIDDEYIQVKWSKVSNADGYQIYRSASKNGTYKRIATVKASKRIYNDKSVKIGKKYYYKVRAYIKKNGKNTYGKFSSTVPEEIVDLNKIEVFVPYPQVPADGTKNADFNAETITCKKI